jgi:hypothetical protein
LGHLGKGLHEENFDQIYEDDVKPFKFYPVLTIGVSYTF